MSALELSDLQLDRLLALVGPPEPPRANLADRIFARSLRTPQRHASRFAIARRHGPRHRPVLWSAVIAANLMAVAAAAASWDGRQFDFHRLTSLPEKVAAAIHVGRHRRDARELPAGASPRLAPQVASLPQHPFSPADRTPAARPVPSPATTIAIPPSASHRPLLVGRAERSHIRARAAAQHAVSSFHFVPDRAREPHRQAVAGARPVESAERTAETLRQPIRQAHVDPARPEERRDLRTADPQRQEADTSTNIPSKKADQEWRAAPVQETDKASDKPGRDVGARGHRWRSPFMRRPHPREGGRRFRGRF